MAHRHKVVLRLDFPLKNTFFPPSADISQQSADSQAKRWQWNAYFRLLFVSFLAKCKFTPFLTPKCHKQKGLRGEWGVCVCVCPLSGGYLDVNKSALFPYF